VSEGSHKASKVGSLPTISTKVLRVGGIVSCRFHTPIEVGAVPTPASNMGVA
jgi:hypothetical protein